MKKTFERYHIEAVEAPSKVKPPSKFQSDDTRMLYILYNKDVISNRCKEQRGLAI